MSVQMKKRNWLMIRSLHSKDVSENLYDSILIDRGTTLTPYCKVVLVGIYLPLTCMVTPKFDVKLPLKNSPFRLSDDI